MSGSAAAISISVDGYGKYARASLLADFLELIALRRGSALQTDLQLSLERDNWHRVRRGLFTVDPDFELDQVEELEGEDGTEDPGDADWPQWAMALIRQRLDVLGTSYPFRVLSDGIEARSDSASSEYSRLLALTLAHVHSAPLENDPRETFELVVVASLGSAGLRSVGMGTATSKGKAFPLQLQESAAAVGLFSAPVPKPAKVFAKDAGVDAIAVLHWGDRRPGQLILIAQATMTESAQWERKIAEPKAHHWANYLLEAVNPISMLAVPYHVEDDHFRYLLAPGATIVDRLRLVGKLGPVSVGEVEALTWLRSAQLEY
ncbi:hypothetical protein [Agrococcus sp. ProA11]|uniref:hypothetical protein n=1 Tax=Agrococcus chionoecetis TaxID=3153752 RepID=UPI0032608417